MPTADPEEDYLWWGQPLDARRYHIFEGDGPMPGSLCGNWMLAHDGQDPEVEPDDDVRDGKDCKTCGRKAGLLDDDGGD